MKCSDLPDRPILEFLAAQERPATHWWLAEGNSMPTVAEAMPEGPRLPDNLRRAKMAQLLKRGLVSGCACGCRGDWELTAKGRALLRGTTPAPATIDLRADPYEVLKQVVRALNSAP